MDRKTLSVGLGIFLVIAVAAFVTFLFGRNDTFRGTSYDQPYPAASDFNLIRANGETFKLSDQRGKVSLLFFGYTSCPDICPTTMAELKQALDRLSPDNLKQVQVIFVTVDPKRDTPELVQEYVDHFNQSSFIGLSGSEQELAKVWNAYGIYRLEVPGASAAGYSVDHTARITMIDKNGNMRVSFGIDTPVDDLVHDIQLLLKKG
jgi:protein SCO1/2